MASKLYNLIVGSASVGAGAYFTTWLLTGENPTVCINYVELCNLLFQNNRSVLYLGEYAYFNEINKVIIL